MNSHQISLDLTVETGGSREWFIVEITGIKDRFCNQIYRLLLEYKDKLFFYECPERTNLLVKEIKEVENENQFFLPEIKAVKKHLFTFQWVYVEQQFEAITKELENLHLPSDHLQNLVIEIIDEWEKRYPFIPTNHIERNIKFHKWTDVTKWFTHFRDVIKMTAGNGYAGDVVNSILIALKLVQDRLHEGLTAEEVAKTVNMSRSYFNKCFKDIVGNSFHQFLREVRIEKAKTMIEQTNESLHWIAEQIGYLDEKYFSRVFREQTGFLPSEYRRLHRNGEKRLQ